MVQVAYFEYKILGKEGSSKEPSVELLNYLRLFSTRFEKLLNIKSRVQVELPPTDHVPLYLLNKNL